MPQSMKKQRGAFLVIGMMLLIVLSALSIAAMSIAYTSTKVGRNYSKFESAQMRAVTMAAYAKRVLSSYTDGVWPDPQTCNSTGTCNGLAGYPDWGQRPVFTWSSGISDGDLAGGQSDAWWTSHGYGFPGGFGGGGNARVIVKIVSQSSTDPWPILYRITGYGTDSTGTVRATATLYHQRLSFWPDPYPASGYNLYTAGNNGCSQGCPYGSCCNSSGVCSTSQATCESNYGSYVPAGWSCGGWFVNMRGFSYNAMCYNGYPLMQDMLYYARPAQAEIANWVKSHGSCPGDRDACSLSYDGYVGAVAVSYVYAYYCSFFVAQNGNYWGNSNSGLVFGTTGVLSQYGTLPWGCRAAGNPTLPANLVPPQCTGELGNVNCNGNYNGNITIC
ncbi:MAG TPA: hypothetical protein VLG38_04785, partial [Gammaproteobacteria bacterium]|nr:hypothetical protein [Gammaproteobacteria bacterium]